jgi:D-tyrosyl-tRNA(Tyr) deacylase
MRAVVQRVKQARVEVDGRITGEIAQGLLIFLGVGEEDTEKDCDLLANKVVNLRVFSDKNDLMNLSLLDINGSALVVSQFTLWGDCRKGRRPSFAKAAKPDKARELYDCFVETLNALEIRVETGEFQEMMDVHLVNDGPVTLLLDSAKSF